MPFRACLGHSELSRWLPASVAEEVGLAHHGLHVKRGQALTPHLHNRFNIISSSSTREWVRNELKKAKRADQDVSYSLVDFVEATPLRVWTPAPDTSPSCGTTHDHKQTEK